MASKIETVGDEEKKSLKLFNYGFLNFFKSGEYHHNNQPLIKTLHTAIRTHDLQLYNLYEQSVKSRPPTTLRDALEFGQFILCFQSLPSSFRPITTKDRPVDLYSKFLLLCTHTNLPTPLPSPLPSPLTHLSSLTLFLSPLSQHLPNVNPFPLTPDLSPFPHLSPSPSPLSQHPPNVNPFLWTKSSLPKAS